MDRCKPLSGCWEPSRGSWQRAASALRFLLSLPAQLLIYRGRGPEPQTTFCPISYSSFLLVFYFLLLLVSQGTVQLNDAVTGPPQWGGIWEERAHKFGKLTLTLTNYRQRSSSWSKTGTDLGIIYFSWKPPHAQGGGPVSDASVGRRGGPWVRKFSLGNYGPKGATPLRWYTHSPHGHGAYVRIYQNTVWENVRPISMRRRKRLYDTVPSKTVSLISLPGG